MSTPTPDTAPLGLLGGTFDPIHFGHLHLADTAREVLGLAAVRFIPAGHPPHRHRPETPGADRLEMVKCAIADNPGFECDAREIDSPAPSYSVVTLRALRLELGNTRPLVLLLGLDAFLGLTTWYQWRELFSLAHIAVANRPGFALEPSKMAPELAAEYLARHAPVDALAAAPAGRIVAFDITPLAISATHIRAQIEAGRSVRYLCPDAVLHYIGAHRLYR